MTAKKFTGDKKLPMNTLLAPYERRFIDALTPRFPKWIEGYHLTLMTIAWSVGTAAFGYLAAYQNNLHWLWLSSLMLVLQWFTRSVSGGRSRREENGSRSPCPIEPRSCLPHRRWNRCRMPRTANATPPEVLRMFMNRVAEMKIRLMSR